MPPRHESPPGDLPEGYYLANFETLLGFVSRTYGELLHPAERHWVSAFSGCPEPARRLYVRLIGRKGGMFRVGRLAYPEIEDISKAVDTLALAGLGRVEPPVAFADLLATFTKPELHARAGAGLARSLTRPELVARLLALDGTPEGARVRARLLAGERWLTVHGHAHLALFTLCFFGNLYQDTSEFVLSDLGAVRYERYRIDTRSRAFQSRAQIDAHLSVFECLWLFEHVHARDADAQLALVSALPPCDEEDVALRRRRDRLLNRVARALERLGRTDEALDLYARSARPPARERRVRLLIAAGRTREAEALCADIARAPLGEAELQFVARGQVLLARANGGEVPPVRTFRPRVSRLALRPREVRVEWAARAFYARDGECHYVENSLVTGMLGLFVWDIVFAALPGAFFHPFQSAPADFREPTFRLAREALFAARLAELDAGATALATRVRETWRTRRGVSNPLVHWRWLSAPVIERALERVPAAHWRAMFERVLADTRENTTGLPDLIRFPAEGGYELIEIKGPGDTLQANQRRWMRYFAEHGIPCRLVHVRWIDARVS